MQSVWLLNICWGHNPSFILLASQCSPTLQHLRLSFLDQFNLYFPPVFALNVGSASLPETLVRTGPSLALSPFRNHPLSIDKMPSFPQKIPSKPPLPAQASRIDIDPSRAQPGISDLSAFKSLVFCFHHWGLRTRLCLNRCLIFPILNARFFQSASKPWV